MYDIQCCNVTSFHTLLLVVLILYHDVNYLICDLFITLRQFLDLLCFLFVLNKILFPIMNNTSSILTITLQAIQRKVCSRRYYNTLHYQHFVNINGVNRIPRRIRAPVIFSLLKYSFWTLIYLKHLYTQEHLTKPAPGPPHQPITLNGCQGLYPPGKSGRGVKLTTYPHPVTRF
jgi:hypothetical protein